MSYLIAFLKNTSALHPTDIDVQQTRLLEDSMWRRQNVGSTASDKVS